VDKDTLRATLCRLRPEGMAAIKATLEASNGTWSPLGVYIPKLDPLLRSLCDLHAKDPHRWARLITWADGWIAGQEDAGK